MCLEWNPPRWYSSGCQRGAPSRFWSSWSSKPWSWNRFSFVFNYIFKSGFRWAKDFNPLPFIFSGASTSTSRGVSEHSPQFRSQFREHWKSTSSHSPHLMP